MDYILILILAGIAFWAGWHFRTITILIKISENPDHMIRILEQIKKLNQEEKEQLAEGTTMPDNVVPMEIERVNGVVYAYNKTTGQFLAQAHDIAQAARIAGQRFPGQTFWHPELKQDTQTT